MPQTVFIYMQMFLHSSMPAKLVLLPGSDETQLVTIAQKPQ